MRTYRRKASILLLLALCVAAGGPGCAQPILEAEECIASRDVVRRFYSFHFGNEMSPSAENLEKRRKYLSERFYGELSGTPPASARDSFTLTDDYPKAFRVGKCETLGPDRAGFEVLLFWRTEERNIQREIRVEAVREDGGWKIDRVAAPKKP